MARSLLYNFPFYLILIFYLNQKLKHAPTAIYLENREKRIIERKNALALQSTVKPGRTQNKL